MNHAYISENLDEKVVVQQAKDRSKRTRWNPTGDAWEIHYHPEAVPCKAKYRHRIFSDGYERVLNQSGGA